MSLLDAEHHLLTSIRDGCSDYRIAARSPNRAKGREAFILTQARAIGAVRFSVLVLGERAALKADRDALVVANSLLPQVIAAYEGADIPQPKIIERGPRFRRWHIETDYALSKRINERLWQAARTSRSLDEGRALTGTREMFVFNLARSQGQISAGLPAAHWYAREVDRLGRKPYATVLRLRDDEILAAASRRADLASHRSRHDDCNC